MPVFLAGLIGALLTFVASAVGRVLLAMGLGYVVFTGLTTSISWLQSQIQTSFGGMDAVVVNFMAWLWVDKAISMLFSAWTVAITFKLAGSTALRKLVQK
jgi:hypothetical protein